MRNSLGILKERLAAMEGGQHSRVGGLVPLKASKIDLVLGGGIARGALHEVYAAEPADAPSASCFGLVMALQVGEERPVVWVRHDYATGEAGWLHAPGLAELGLDPGRVILVRARSAIDALRAGAEAAACGGLGAVLIEVWGSPATIDLTATRRLSITAATSSVTLMMIRAGVTPTPSAASTRWSVRTAASTPFEANAPGHSAFDITLLRSRNGVSGNRWIVEWDRDRRAFNDAAAVAGGMASVLADRSPAAKITAWKESKAGWRKAG